MPTNRLIIQWKPIDSPTRPHKESFRVKNMGQASRIISKRQQQNMQYAKYYNQDMECILLVGNRKKAA
jgi:hypothetical protein